MGEHYATAMSLHYGAVLIGCRCGELIQTSSGDPLTRAWDKHLAYADA